MDKETEVLETDVDTGDESETSEGAEVKGKVSPTRSNSDLDKLMGEIKTLRETVAKATKRTDGGRYKSEDRETIDRINAEIGDLRKQIESSARDEVSRKAEFDMQEELDRVPAYSKKHLEAAMQIRTAPGSDIDDLQLGNDELYIAKTLLKVKNPMDSDVLRNYARERYPALYKAMNTGSNTAGGNWIPTGFSNQLTEQVRLQLRVAALHGRFNMPTNPFTLPIEGADINAYRVAEATGDNDDLDTSKRVPTASPTTKNLTFQAEKLGVRVLTSAEITEDSIIPMIPYVRDKILMALANAQEEGVISGDTNAGATTHIDAISDTGSRFTAYDGYRKTANSAGATVDLSTFSLANIRKLRAAMGKYGVDMRKLAFVGGINVWNQLVGLSEVTTVDKYGSRATVLTGELGRLDGIPIVISEYVPENMDANGLNAGVTVANTKSGLYLVRTDAFQFGDWRQIELKSRDIIETDQIVLVALQRLDFQNIYAGDKVVAAGVGIALV